MYKSKVDGKYDFLIEKIKNHLYINGIQKEFDIHRFSDTSFHIIHDQKPYKVSILQFDIPNKTLEIKVNENTHTVELQDENDLLLEKMGILNIQKKKTSDLKAPMPGLIMEVRVSEGQQVKSGEPLIVLKAMKMENILRSPHDGIITQILVEKNQKIEKDDVILQF